MSVLWHCEKAIQATDWGGAPLSLIYFQNWKGISLITRTTDISLLDTGNAFLLVQEYIKAGKQMIMFTF